MTASMYAASQEFFRMEKKRRVAARYVRNSDPSKKDSEVQQAQLDALSSDGRSDEYEWIDDEEYTKERYVLNTTVIYVDINGTEWTEPKVIVFCYDCCLDGMSLYTIALTLTRLGIPTQRGKPAWDAGTVRNYLTN